ncbi:hypothetical protein PVAND_007977 [Polypedilum vanderplanki]|uniref:MARVEL domain-containing protein n=1 Tax=Polypedilum vanderplanki TaxID=319348 RepID=A0A9J6C8C7_POLVA|nr:hypothetical protein PVAND_007977 [Polypedilum vanderplanki]
MSETVISLNQSSSHRAGSTNNYDAADLRWIQFNFNYFKHTDGVLKLAQLILAIICMILASPAFLSGTHFFLFAIVLTFICTILWSVAHFLGIRDVLNLPINWSLSEFVNFFIASTLLFLASIVQLITWFGRSERVTGRNIAAGFVGIIDMIAYALSAYFLYLQYKFSKST